MAKLTALSVKALGEPGRHGDGDGLYLHVAPSGTKFWVQRIVSTLGAGTSAWGPTPP